MGIVKKGGKVLKIKSLSIAACSLLSLGIIAPNSAVFAESSENVSTVSSEVKSGEYEIMPLVNWSGSATLSTKTWNNITSSNNFFKDSPTVTNNANNSSSIKVRIVDTSGKVIGSTKTVGLGKTVTMDQIPAFSGTYTLQGKSLDKNGTFSIKID